MEPPPHTMKHYKTHVAPGKRSILKLNGGGFPLATMQSFIYSDKSSSKYLNKVYLIKIYVIFFQWPCPLNYTRLARYMINLR